MHTWVKNQSIGEVLLTFLALYIITQLFWMVIALQDASRNKIGELWTFEVAIMTIIRMRLKFKVARTPQFATEVLRLLDKFDNEVAIMTIIRMRLKFKVARTPQFTTEVLRLLDKFDN